MKTEIPISIQIFSASPELFSAMEDRLKNAEVQKIAGLNFIFTRCYREGSSIRGSLTEIYLDERSPWAGEGLPPVGTVCEVLENKTTSTWSKAKIIAHVTDDPRFNPIAIYIPEGDPLAVVGQAVPAWFRPLRTPEQIAAEDGQKELDSLTHELYRDIGMEPRDAEILFNKGYRKQVQP